MVYPSRRQSAEVGSGGQEFVAFYGQEVQAAEMLEKIKAQIWEHKKRGFWQSLGLI